MSCAVLSSSSIVKLSIIPESDCGVTPPGVGPGADFPRELRMTGESLQQSLSKISSKEINSSRQIRDLITDKSSVSGGVNFEFSVNEYDTLIAATLQNPWVDYGVVAGASNSYMMTFTVTPVPAVGATPATTDERIVFASAPSGADALSNLVVGQYFRIGQNGGVALVPPAGALLPAAYQKVYRVKAIISATEIQVEPGSVPATLATAGAGRIIASRLTNGVTQKAFSIQRAHLDVQQFFIYRGCHPSKFSLKMDTGAIVTGMFDFIGMTSAQQGTDFFTGYTYIPSTTNPVISGVTGVTRVDLDGQAFDKQLNTFVKSVSFDYDNKMEGQDAIGHLGFIGVRSGTIDCKGSMQVYLHDARIYNDYIAGIRHDFSITLQDTNGKGYTFTFPEIDFSAVKVNASQQDQSVMMDINWQALMDPTQLKTIFVDRF